MLEKYVAVAKRNLAFAGKRNAFHLFSVGDTKVHFWGFKFRIGSHRIPNILNVFGDMLYLLYRPHLQSRNFMDALLAFWPGLQVLLGDVRPAVETHEMLYQVMQRHTFIPEAFTSDFQVFFSYIYLAISLGLQTLALNQIHCPYYISYK